MGFRVQMRILGLKAKVMPRKWTRTDNRVQGFGIREIQMRIHCLGFRA